MENESQLLPVTIVGRNQTIWISHHPILISFHESFSGHLERSFQKLHIVANMLNTSVSVSIPWHQVVQCDQDVQHRPVLEHHIILIQLSWSQDFCNIYLVNQHSFTHKLNIVTVNAAVPQLPHIYTESFLACILSQAVTRYLQRVLKYIIFMHDIIL